MFTTVIDWIGRGYTITQLSTYLLKGLKALQENDIKRLEQAKAYYMKIGFSAEKAKVFALSEAGYLENPPEKVCRDLGIK